MTGQTPAPDSPHLRALRNLNDLDLGALAADAGVDLVKAPAGQIGAFLDAIRESGPGWEGDLREAAERLLATHPKRGRLAGWGADVNVRETLLNLAHLGGAVRVAIDALIPDPGLERLRALAAEAKRQADELAAWDSLGQMWAPRHYLEAANGKDTAAEQRKRLAVKLGEHWRVADLSRQLAAERRISADRLARRNDEVREATLAAGQERDAARAELREAQRELGGWRRIAEDAIRRADGFVGEGNAPERLDHAGLRERTAGLIKDRAADASAEQLGKWRALGRRLLGAPENRADVDLRDGLRAYVAELIEGSAAASDRLQSTAAELAKVRAGTEQEVKDLAGEVAAHDLRASNLRAELDRWQDMGRKVRNILRTPENESIFTHAAAVRLAADSQAAAVPEGSVVITAEEAAELTAMRVSVGLPGAVNVRHLREHVEAGWLRDAKGVEIDRTYGPRTRRTIPDGADGLPPPTVSRVGDEVRVTHTWPTDPDLVFYYDLAEAEQLLADLATALYPDALMARSRPAVAAVDCRVRQPIPAVALPAPEQISPVGYAVQYPGPVTFEAGHARPRILSDAELQALAAEGPIARLARAKPEPDALAPLRQPGVLGRSLANLASPARIVAMVLERVSADRREIDRLRASNARLAAISGSPAGKGKAKRIAQLEAVIEQLRKQGATTTPQQMRGSRALVALSACASQAWAIGGISASTSEPAARQEAIRATFAAIADLADDADKAAGAVRAPHSSPLARLRNALADLRAKAATAEQLAAEVRRLGGINGAHASSASRATSAEASERKWREWAGLALGGYAHAGGDEGLRRAIGERLGRALADRDASRRGAEQALEVSLRHEQAAQAHARRNAELEDRLRQVKDLSGQILDFARHAAR